jgi:hypothetical protein
MKNPCAINVNAAADNPKKLTGTPIKIYNMATLVFHLFLFCYCEKAGGRRAGGRQGKLKHCQGGKPKGQNENSDKKEGKGCTH